MLMAPETGEVYRIPTAERLEQFSTCIHASLASTIGYGFWFIFLILESISGAFQLCLVLPKPQTQMTILVHFFSKFVACSSHSVAKWRSITIACVQLLSLRAY